MCLTTPAWQHVTTPGYRCRSVINNLLDITYQWIIIMWVAVGFKFVLEWTEVSFMHVTTQGYDACDELVVTFYAHSKLAPWRCSASTKVIASCCDHRSFYFFTDVFVTVPSLFVNVRYCSVFTWVCCVPHLDTLYEGVQRITIRVSLKNWSIFSVHNALIKS